MKLKLYWHEDYNGFEELDGVVGVDYDTPGLLEITLASRQTEMANIGVEITEATITRVIPLQRLREFIVERT